MCNKYGRQGYQIKLNATKKSEKHHEAASMLSWVSEYPPYRHLAFRIGKVNAFKNRGSGSCHGSPSDYDLNTSPSSSNQPATFYTSFQASSTTLLAREPLYQRIPFTGWKEKEEGSCNIKNPLPSDPSTGGAKSSSKQEKPERNAQHGLKQCTADRLTRDMAP